MPEERVPPIAEIKERYAQDIRAIHDQFVEFRRECQRNPSADYLAEKAKQDKPLFDRLHALNDLPEYIQFQNLTLRESIGWLLLLQWYYMTEEQQREYVDELNLTEGLEI